MLLKAHLVANFPVSLLIAQHRNICYTLCAYRWWLDGTVTLVAMKLDTKPRGKHRKSPALVKILSARPQLMDPSSDSSSGRAQKSEHIWTPEADGPRSQSGLRAGSELSS